MTPWHTSTAMSRPSGDELAGLALRWGHDRDTGQGQLGIWFKGRCIQVGFEDRDRALSGNEFYHRFIHPALLALAVA
jgi:hypothetical protein